ncbi:MAG: PIG-L family deacetylase [Acidobacteria bacterium]|nr:PIG-L family deacetylase [Acidobacteriota bacterium]
MREVEGVVLPNHMRESIRTKLALVAAVLLLPALAHAQSSVVAVTNRTTYNVGSEVLMRLVQAPGASLTGNMVFSVTVRYAGDSHTVYTTPASQIWTCPSDSATSSYSLLWKSPAGDRTGRYEIDLLGYDRISGEIMVKAHAAGLFAVHRKLVKIERISLGKTFYVTGDHVECDITLKNLTDQPLDSLRVEFSNRYWPWIAGPAQQAAASIVTLRKDLDLAPGAEQTIHSSDAAVAGKVSQPAIHQYGVVVWDRDRKNVLDIAFSKLVLIRPPGVTSPEPYPLQYAYPELSDVDTKDYRHFYPPGLNAGAIQLDTSHTMYMPGQDASIHFSITNPGTVAWKQITADALLLDPDGKPIEKKLVASRLEISPGATPEKESVTFALPAGPAGLYRAEVVLSDASGNTVAENNLELGANPLPKSIMIFCAHEDDEGGWAGLIRAAIENHIPIHFVYFTGGDAGSCDLYYEHSCNPAEALNFGTLRMDETRAVLGHMGVPKDDIYFLGLPDGGSGEIWYHHPDPADPYLSVLLASDHTPYPNVFEPNLPFARDSVVAAVKRLLKEFHPEVVVTAHPPSEGHIDHIVNNYLVVRALQEMVRAKELSPQSIKLYVDRIYNPKTIPSTSYHYSEHVLFVSGEVMALHQEAGWYYQSQGGNRAQGHLRDFNTLPRRIVYRQVLDWNEHKGWNSTP